MIFLRGSFLSEFAGGKEALEKQKTVDIKERLIGFVENASSRKKVGLLPPATRPSPAATPSFSKTGLNAEMIDTVAHRRGKVLPKEKTFHDEGHGNPGHLHTRMIRLTLPGADRREQRNYFLKSQDLTISGVDEVPWDRDDIVMRDEDRILFIFGRYSDLGGGNGDEKFDSREILVFNSLYGFYDIPTSFLHVLLHAALHLPTPVLAKAHEFIDAMTRTESGHMTYAAAHLPRSGTFKDYCLVLKEHEVDSETPMHQGKLNRTRIADKALIYDRCFTKMEDIIHRLTLIREVGNYSRFFIATDLEPTDPEDILLNDLPWVQGAI